MDKDKNNAVLQAQKLEALGLFAGGIAHDFNNILSIIEGYTHIALKKLNENNLTPDQLQKIIQSTQRGAGLTRQLLAFGRQKIDTAAKTGVTGALRAQHVLLKPLLGETIRFAMSLPESNMWVQASEDQMTQIVLNLALNARDALPTGGTVTLSCEKCLKKDVPPFLRKKSPKREFLRLRVSDNGAGISKEILDKIFDPFFTTKEQGKGTGLGLSVVYGIVDQLEGTITVDSTPGRGTKFDVFLPLTPPPEDTLIQDIAVQPAGLQGRTILVAEDEPELRDILATMLEGMDMKVLTASNGNQALMVQDDYDGNIDFLLTDVVMPEMDGVRLGELFSSVRPDSNVVYMSGYPFLERDQNLTVPPSAAFLEKPLQEDKIRRILERALEKNQQRLREQGVICLKTSTDTGF